MDKIVKYGAIAFLLFFVVTAPEGAADIIEKSINLLEDIGEGVSDFVTSTTATL